MLTPAALFRRADSSTAEPEQAGGHGTASQDLGSDGSCWGHQYNSVSLVLGVLVALLPVDKMVHVK